MATNQYIGARYVPLFAEPAQWDKTKQYEPLTIVMHEGNSYTSRQFVPAGIELANDAFWALTGNYNAQVEQYRQEVTTYDGRIKTAQATAADAAMKATKADTKATSASAAVEAETSRATAKEAEIQSLAKTNETDIAHLDAQMAATTGSELLNKIAKETGDRTKADKTLGDNIDREKTERQAAITTLDTQLKAEIASKFPIGTDSILDGAITSTKLAQSAINAILNGVTVRCFNSKNPNADNTGMVCPSGFEISGCYIDALKLLIINKLESTNVRWASAIDTTNRNGITLPSYVPKITGNPNMSSCGLIVWSENNYFKTWSGLVVGTERYIGPSSTIEAGNKASIFGTAAICLAPFIVGNGVTNAQYADYATQNEVI